MLPLSVSIAEIMLAGALLTKSLQIAQEDKSGEFGLKIFRQPLFWPWMAYLVAALISCLLSINPQRSLSYLNSDFLKASACLFLIASMPYGKSREYILNSYLTGAAAAAAWALGKFAHGLYRLGPNEFIIAGASRTTSTVNPITYGTVLSFAFFLTAALILNSKKEEQKAWRYALLLTTGLALLLNQSYGVYLGCAAVLVLMALFAKANRLKLLVPLLILALLVAPAALLKKSNRFSLLLPQVSIFVKKSAGLEVPTTESAKTSASISMRLDLWKTGLQILKDYPLTGVGPANVRQSFDYYHPQPFIIEHKKVFGFGNLHNLYLHQAAERGLLGLGALLYLFVALLRYAWNLRKRTDSPYTLWAFCMLPGFYLMNISETSFQHALPSLSMCLMLGLAASAAEEERPPSENPPAKL